MICPIFLALMCLGICSFLALVRLRTALCEGRPNSVPDALDEAQDWAHELDRALGLAPTLGTTPLDCIDAGWDMVALPPRVYTLGDVRARMRANALAWAA